MANVPDDPNAGASGAEYETILALRRQGHEVDAVWRDEITHRISHGNFHNLLELPREYERIAREHLSRCRYDVVHVNQPHGYRAARLVQRFWPHTVFIHRSHGWEPRVHEVLSRWKHVYPSDGRSAMRRLASYMLQPFIARHAKLITQWADGHIVCSTEDADYMKQRNGVESSKIGVMPQAAPDSFNLIAPRPMNESRLRTVLYVGQFAFVKAPMITAQAMNEIAKERSDARFVWVTGAKYHDAVVDLLSAEVRERLQLFDWMPQERLQEVYDGAGVFLLPSFFEGSGKVHIEAMSRGLCVVASRVGGMLDYVQDGISGVLVSPGDARAVAGAAVATMSDRHRASAMSAAAARRSREFSWMRTAIETAAFYRACIARKGAAHTSYPLPG